MSEEHFSRPSTPVATETMIHRPNTPQASESIVNILSRAGLCKSFAPKKHTETKPCPGPRKLTVSIADGNTDRLVHKYVPSRLLMAASAKATEVLVAKPWAGTFKVYGKYDPITMNDVINTIVLSQKMPITEDLLSNLFTYKACLRLGIQPTHAQIKLLVVKINMQISSAPISKEILAFIATRIGPKDVVFKHTANALCHQRFTGQIDDLKGFERMVSCKSALQKKMVQIDQAHKARREAIVASKRQRKQKAVAEKKGPADALAAELEAATTADEVAAVERKMKLLSLFKSDSN
ncbi:hypothetical protein G6514_009260 [Epicoccum nigrum]|nr:hypothetical protein G6514_009260 [Epicoccum nigrum]